MNNKTQNMETNENANPQLANENKIKNNLGEQLLSEVIEKETKVEVPNEVVATDVKVQSKNAQFSPIAEEFEKLKRDVAKNEFVEEIENEIPNATGMELLNDDVEEIPKLVDPILQRVGLASFIGSSDVGKSSLLRHLCICVVFGLKFLYWEVKALYHRAIYVSTEDDRTSISSLLKKQNKDYGLIPEDLEGLLFIFETDNLLERLERELKKQPVDLIVIDAFADIFSAELYKTNEVRAFLNQYNQLAQKYGCLIIFLHHTRKSSEELMPSKNNSLGSQGYEAKMRFMAEVKSNVQFPDKKHFCIVKGNYLSNDFKTKSFDFEFTENLTFNSLNTRTPFEKLNSKEESFETLEAEYNEIMSLLDKGLKYRDIALKFGVSHTTIYRKVRKFEKIRSSNNQEEN